MHTVDSAEMFHHFVSDIMQISLYWLPLVYIKHNQTWGLVINAWRILKKDDLKTFECLWLKTKTKPVNHLGFRLLKSTRSLLMWYCCCASLKAHWMKDGPFNVHTKKNIWLEAALSKKMKVEDGSCRGADAPGLRHNSWWALYWCGCDVQEQPTKYKSTQEEDKPAKLYSIRFPHTCYGSLSIVTETIWPPSLCSLLLLCCVLLPSPQGLVSASAGLWLKSH